MQKTNRIFLFVNKINDNLKFENIKHNKFSIIYRDYDNKNNLEKVLDLVKRKKIPLYCSSNNTFLKKTKIDGIYIPSFKKNNILFYKNYEKIGSAHNALEIYRKQRQGCKIIFISPVFEDSKKRKSLGIIKFNLLIKNFKGSFCMLGGINIKNIKKIKLANAHGIAGVRFAKYLEKFVNYFNLIY